MNNMIGKTILHYKIIEELGRGGMGIVYKAHDIKLDRIVAIKILPQLISDNLKEKERFENEAKAAAALNHPNIATIYAIEESDHEIFIVMEFIEGRELKDIIKSEIPNPKSAIDYAIQIARGLQAAHKRGVVHRDIKSSNIMITEEGQVKVMDFGLAKTTSSPHLTQIGSTVGTPYYMSPEQTKGGEVDHRTDIWSFGVVLYEMLTGQLPFKGDYQQAIVYSILNEEPAPINNLNPAVIDSLQRIVTKSLKKDVRERYQNISKLITDLTELKSNPTIEAQAGKSPKRRRAIIIAAISAGLILFALSLWYFGQNNPEKMPDNIVHTQSKSQLERLAILPFVNLRSDRETDFLGYALADQIIGGLAYVKNISVRPSSAIRKYQDEVPDIAVAAKELQVDYVLTGNYLKQDSLVRLNVELVNANSNELVWREPIEVKYNDAFTLQDIVAKKVLEGLQLQFTPAEQERIQADIPQNPLAYEYYLRGISYPNTTQSNQLAVEMLQKSIQLDSTFAPAYAELGSRYHRLATYKFGGTAQLQLAEKYLHKASALNAELLKALGNLAMIYTETAKTAEAVEITRKMLKINPNNPDAHFSLGYIYRYGGMLEESAKECEIAISLDPKPRFRSAGVTYLYLGKFDKALKGLNLDSNSPFSLSWKAQLFLRQGKEDSALKYCDEVMSADPNSTSGYWATAMEAYLIGNNSEGIRIIDLLAASNPTDGEVWYNIANMYGLLQNKEACIEALQKAIDGGFYNYPFMHSDYFLDSVRNKPEFQQILAQAKEKHEAFKKKFFHEQSKS